MTSHLSSILQAFPLKTLVFAVFLSFVIVSYPPLSMRIHYKGAEHYPFSSFPMYSTFAPQANVVFFTDENDQPLPTYPTFGIVSSAMKKSYARHLQALKEKLDIPTYSMTPEQKRPAGDAFLNELKNSVSPHAFENNALPHLKLYETIITRDDTGNITETTHFITELISTPNP
jgi:hypothetical protein